ncbi:MAG: hypothetical protein QOH06_3362 [Acidobacteriota bacterium]|jgi:CHAT domain-containing protein/lipopolysaccharide biosynthesis regulator YciM|nr:hypothetical protein [Acidobacteriota bacterium]
MKARFHVLLAMALLCLGPAFGAAALEEIPASKPASKSASKSRTDLEAALAEAPDAQTRVAILEALGESYQYANEMARAEASFRAAVEAGEAAWGESLQVASSMARQGNILRLQYQLDAAAKLQRRALEIRERLAPDSLEVADSLNQLAFVAWDQGDLDAMSESIGRALAIQERWPADTLVMADTLNAQSFLVAERGHYADASAALRRALTILEQRSPDSIPMATSLARLGLIDKMLGDVDSMVELQNRALAIRERLAPESLGTASILLNLGTIAQERGNLDEAEERCRRALAIWTKAAPKSNGVVGSLNALGIIARLRGELDKAEELHRKALEIARSDIKGVVLGHLARVAEARGDLKLAVDLHQQALAIHQSAPGQYWAPVTLQELGRLHLRMGHPDRAAQLLDQAVEAMESTAEGLGGSRDTQAGYRASHEEIYRDAIQVALQRGRDAEAFHLLERSRAKSFLMLLAERDLTFPGELPEALERSRRDNAARYDEKLREISQATGAETKEALQRDLDRLRQERDDVAVEIRKASPRLAALREPQPLDLDAARKVLDPGTLSLSYSVGKEKTILFAVTQDGGLQVKTLPVGEERLRRQVTDFLDRVRSQQAPAKDLYSELIAPVAGLVERSERVLILPDGPLHRLPFGALVRDDGRFLTELKPLHTALSLTVYGTLRAASSPAGKSGYLVAFGDPSFPKSMQAKDNLGPGLRSFGWTRLPYSRREVEQIAGVYPGARLYLGEEATEEHAKLIHDARILHFATHGYTDDRTPLDSALVLTIPEKPTKRRENGLLQVWEIFEGVRIDADLVVLSACESALGRELSGEGLIGLTRAFQYAGARSVVASLWSVADQVTAELMARFHRHLAAGLPKDQALRAAQLELIREPVKITTASGQAIETDASAPFFWAAFQLFGDWRR